MTDATEWKPFATVPRVHDDKLLVWSAWHGLCGAEWVSEDLDLIGWDEAGWMITPVFDGDAYDDDMIEDGDLTHWMPAPNAKDKNQ